MPQRGILNVLQSKLRAPHWVNYPRIDAHKVRSSTRLRNPSSDDKQRFQREV